MQAAIGLYSIYQGVQAGKQADRDRAQRDRMASEATQLGLEDRKYYRDKYGPLNQMLIDYAMGNKPSPYLAKAKGRVEAGYQEGSRMIDTLYGGKGFGMSGIGSGQRIGLSMERARAEAGLDLADQAQRYGVAQSLSGMEGAAMRGTALAAHGLGTQSAYSASDLARSSGYQNEAFSDAANALGSYVENLGEGANWYGVKPTRVSDQRKEQQASSIESGGTKPGWSFSGGVGAGGFTGKL